MTRHGLLTAVAALACLTSAPGALADEGSPEAADPAAAAMALAAAALADLPTLDPTAAPADLGALPSADVQTSTSELAAVTAPEAVPAAAAEPNPAMEPHPSPPPPPPPPDVPTVPESAAEVAVIPAEPTYAGAADEPTAQPQYQPEPARYQPAEVDPAAPAPAAVAPSVADAAGDEWKWDWTWSCGDAAAPAQPPAISGGVIPKTWNWNWVWNCDREESENENSQQKSTAQYQPAIARYHSLNVNVSIRIGSPGDDGPLAQTNIVLGVEAGPVSPTVHAPPPTPVAAPAPVAPPVAAAAPAPAPPASVEAPQPQQTGKLASPKREARSLLGAAHTPEEATSWTARSVESKRLQLSRPEVDRSRPQLRRPTRRPLSPTRAPAIPVGSAGASPLGGSDGGGFGFALLLVPFVLALVDSARRSARDITPPVARAHRQRRERPG